MIDPTRIPELDQVLTRATVTIPLKLSNFYKTCKNMGFTTDQSFELTTKFLEVVVAVPNPIEVPTILVTK